MVKRLENMSVRSGKFVEKGANKAVKLLLAGVATLALSTVGCKGKTDVEKALEDCYDYADRVRRAERQRDDVSRDQARDLSLEALRECLIDVDMDDMGLTIMSTEQIDELGEAISRLEERGDPADEGSGGGQDNVDEGSEDSGE